MPGSFSQFDLVNLQESMDGVNRAILNKKVMEVQQQDKAVQRAQQEIENQQRNRQLDISERGQASTERYQQGELGNRAAATQQRAQDNAAKLAEMQRENAAKQKRWEADLASGNAAQADRARKEILESYDKGLEPIQKAVDNAANPEQVAKINRDISSGIAEVWPKTPESIRNVILSSPPHAVRIEMALKGNPIFYAKPKPELNIQDLPPKPGASQAVTFGNNLRIIGPADANKSIEITSHDGLTDTKRKFSPEELADYERLQRNPSASPAFRKAALTAPTVRPSPAAQPAPLAVPNQASSQQDIQGALNRANQAIANGADPAQVKARFKQLYGIDL